MKKIYKLLWLIAIMFMIMPSAIAQTPSDFGTTGDTSNNPDDSPQNPIDGCLIVLLLSGVGLAFIKHREKVKS